MAGLFELLEGGQVLEGPPLTGIHGGHLQGRSIARPVVERRVVRAALDPEEAVGDRNEPQRIPEAGDVFAETRGGVPGREAVADAP